MNIATVMCCIGFVAGVSLGVESAGVVGYGVAVFFVWCAYLTLDV